MRCFNCILRWDRNKERRTVANRSYLRSAQRAHRAAAPGEPSGCSPPRSRLSPGLGSKREAPVLLSRCIAHPRAFGFSKEEGGTRHHAGFTARRRVPAEGDLLLLFRPPCLPARFRGSVCAPEREDGKPGPRACLVGVLGPHLGSGFRPAASPQQAFPLSHRRAEVHAALPYPGGLGRGQEGGRSPGQGGQGHVVGAGSGPRAGKEGRGGGQSVLSRAGPS